jgi:hypothetical protein
MDFTGQFGGMIAAAFIGAWATATAFWFGVGAIIWKLFFNPRLKALEDQLGDERKECDRQLGQMSNRINQLETMLMLHGPQQLRQAMQAVASDNNLAIDEVKRELRGSGE